MQEVREPHPCTALCAETRAVGTELLPGPPADGEALLALGAVASALHSLSISWCLGVTDVGVAAIAAGCPLEVLSLHGIRGLTAAALDALVAHRAASLVALDVRGCIGMGCPQPASLRARLPRVHTFVIHKG